MSNKRKLNLLKNTLLTFTAMLVLAPISKAQELQGVTNALDKYNRATLQEKIFVHNDKSTYVAGEIMWFKIYCVDATYNKPLTLSKVAYVEVLDAANVSVMQAKVAMENGMGNGSLVIPFTVANGNFKLRAYTSWMRNFGADAFFEKKITIINTTKTPEAVAKSASGNYDVRFFAEGGSLVSGLPSNVAFKGVGRDGLGIAFSGAVVNQANDTVARFSTFKFGMGHFTFTPAANNTYRAVVKIAGEKNLSLALPAIKNNGYTLQAISTDASVVNVTVNNNTGDQQLYLLAHANGKTKLLQTAVSSNGRARFAVSKDKLGDGVNTLTVFDAGQRPVCERLYFKRPKQALFVGAGADAQQYTTRKKVTVTLAAKDNADKMIGADLSMAIYRADSLQLTGPDDIRSYFWLGAEIKGNIESPAYYLDNNSAEADEAVDNLLLTQGWRRFKWDNILRPANTAFNYLPEYNGHLVMAKITDAEKNVSAGEIAYMAVPGKRVQMYVAKSDAQGRLMFNTKEFYGANEIVVQTNTERDTLHKIEVLSPFSGEYSGSTVPDFQLSPGLQGDLQQQGLGMQVQNIYAGAKLKRYFEPTVDSSAFFGRLYSTYMLDDYTRFVTMEEVVREYVREAAVSSSRGRSHITLISSRELLLGDPLVILDGVPVFNIDKLMAVDPLKVQRLQVERERYYWGPSVHEGVMNYTTYKGDGGGVEIDPHATVIDYEGMQLQREFYSPVYETEVQAKSRIPDLRSLLFWSPDIKTGSRSANVVTFYTSDRPGKYLGVVQGMTAGGDAASKVFTFEVK